MWPWKRTGPDLDELRRAIEDLQREVRGLRTEWLDTYEKLHRLGERIRKRQERETEPVPAPGSIHELKASLRARAAAMRGSNGTP